MALLDITSGDILDLARPPNDSTGNIGAFWAAAFAPSGKRVAFGGGDGSVWLWDLARTPSAGSANLPRPERSTRFACCASPMKIISCPWRRTAGCCGGRSGVDEPELVTALKLGARVFRAEVSPNGQWLAAAANGP